MSCQLKYVPLKWFLHLVALLPFWVLYGLADFMYFLIISNIVPYRKKVVRKNLDEAFPELSEKERRKIERKFFRQFADYIVETIKLNHISNEQIKRRISFEGLDIIDDFIDEGKSVVAYLSHCGNWEWVPSITLNIRHEIEKDVAFCQVYRPLKNKWFDKYMLRLRSRFNSRSFPRKTVLRDLLRLKRDGMPTVTGFMSDQNPGKRADNYITMFLNHPTAFVGGTEVIARKMKMAVVYFDISKPSRGHYKVTTHAISGDASLEPENAITEKYVRMLEQTILNTPHIWLWSHKRWKNKVTLPQNEQ